MPLKKQTVVVNATNLTRIYNVGSNRVVGIDGIDLYINDGSFVVLKGDSGSGKSTLLSLLGGLDRLTEGKLIIADHDLTQSSEVDLIEFRRKKVGMIFQSFNLMPTMNVYENVCLPGFLAGRPVKIIQSRARELLEWLGMEKRLWHQAHQLSGGEMQRTAIARALINDPGVVLADEPTGNLDSSNAKKVMALLADLNRQFNRTVIIATHSALADPYATELLTLRDGRLVK